jgi:hypothetical protein
VARLYTPSFFKQPTKPTLKVGGAGQNFSDFTLIANKFSDPELGNPDRRTGTWGLLGVFQHIVTCQHFFGSLSNFKEVL